MEGSKACIIVVNVWSEDSALSEQGRIMRVGIWEGMTFVALNLTKSGLSVSDLWSVEPVYSEDTSREYCGGGWSVGG